MAATEELSIGNLAKRVRIEQQVKTKDDHGAPVIAWALRAVVWAALEPLSYSEALRASQVTGVLNSVLRIWFRSDIAITDRILFGARVLQIVNYQDPTGGQVELRLLVTEVQA